MHAEPIVSAGNWTLLSNTPDQEIDIAISGVANVTNATIFAELVGLPKAPVFTGGSAIDGTIFALNHYAYPSDFVNQLAYLDVITDTGTVNGNGTLAKLWVSTAGITSGDFVLKLTNTPWGDTCVDAQPSVNVTYLDGSIHIVPEPSNIVLLITALLGVGWARHRRRP
jgi:hypothetical protein